MVTALEQFSALDLKDPENMIFGGWDIREKDISTDILSIINEHLYHDHSSDSQFAEALGFLSSNIFRGTSINCGEAIDAISNSEMLLSQDSLKDVICTLKNDIAYFREKNNVDQVVVVNLSSTEPPFPDKVATYDLNKIDKIISENDIGLIRGSTLYAYAAVDSGCAYVNFTPSQGALLPGIIELAEKRGVPLTGSDGKTGETLVKSALAPMFLYRNLKILSWQGYNMLGNMDGKILSHSENKSTKIESKDKILSEIMGYKPHSRVAIDFVPSLGDNKTAWDFIHFEGFLNTKMSLQFTWQGSDSVLAAPLILDLVRMSCHALSNNEKGLMKHLACFFKYPVGVEIFDLHTQFQLLLDYVQKNTNNN